MQVPDLDVNVVDSTGMTPLMWAAYHDSADVVEELLRNGAGKPMQAGPRHVRWVKMLWGGEGSFARNVDEIRHEFQLYDVTDTL